MLKNALDFHHQECNDKPVAFVSYGSDNGVRAVEQLRQVVAELQMAPIRIQVAFSNYVDLIDGKEFRPRQILLDKLPQLFDKLEHWVKVLKQLREDRPLGS